MTDFCHGLLGKNEKRDIRLTLTHVAALLAEPPEQVPWIVNGLLSRGGLSILAGKPKAGKSTLARCIALAVARGAPVVGRATAAGPVLYLALEERRADIADHFRLLGATDEPLHVHVGPAPPNRETATAQLHELIANTGAVLAVVDTMLRFVRVSDVAAYAELTLAMDTLLYLSRDTGCHILAVYHAGKMEREGLDSILGSVAIGGSCDAGLILKRDAGGMRTIHSVQRVGADMPETVLTMDDARNVLPGPTKAEQEELNARQAIRDALDGPPMTEDEIREAVGGNSGKVGKMLRAMLKAGELHRDGEGRSGKPYRYSCFPFSPYEETRNETTDGGDGRAQIDLAATAVAADQARR